MTHTAIMAWTPQNRVAKYANFSSADAADQHVADFAERYPHAFVVLTPDAPVECWLIDTVTKAVSIDAPPVPIHPVAAWRFHAVLRMQGLSGTLETVLAALPDDQEAVARARLEYSQTYDRSDALVAQLGAACGLTTDQLDALWRAGHAL